MGEAYRLSVVNAGLTGLIGAPTYRILEDVTQPAFLDLLDASGIPYRFEKQAHRLTLLDTGSKIFFRSLDNPERLRGPNLAWFGIDELTYCQPAAWSRLEARLRHGKASELSGFAVWTPKGFDWVYELFVGEKTNKDYSMIRGVPKENAANLAEGFYETLARSYDARFYEQEVLGEYLNILSGRAYYGFERKQNLSVDLKFNPNLPLCWALDFNVDPMCSILAQVEDNTSRADIMLGKKRKRVNVLDEICLPDSDVGKACNEFLRRTEGLRIAAGGQLQVNVYGDATGNNRAHSGKTDWELVKQHFRGNGAYQMHYRVPDSNPFVKDRVNAVNAAMINAAQEVRCFIDPRCKQLVADLEQVSWKPDSNGNLTGDLDESDKQRTHVSSALGYMIWSELPILPRGGPMSSRII